MLAGAKGPHRHFELAGPEIITITGMRTSRPKSQKPNFLVNVPNCIDGHGGAGSTPFHPILG